MKSFNFWERFCPFLRNTVPKIKIRLKNFGAKRMLLNFLAKTPAGVSSLPLIFGAEP